MSKPESEPSFVPASCSELLRLEGGEEVRLSAVERLLLVCDGTVTHMLEALTREPVDVIVLDQDCEAGVLDRRVRLETTTGRPLLWARSTIDLDKLDESVGEWLLQEEFGIGNALRKADVETRRSLHGVTIQEPDKASFPEFVPDSAGTLLARTYRVYESEVPIMTIREYMPFGRL